MKYIKLKDVCKINMGQSPDSSSYNESGEGIPFFQGNADFGDRYPVTRIWCSEPKKVAQENDILISVRAPIGAINYSKEKCCIGRGLAALTVDKTKISEKLLFWVLKAKKEELNRQGTGSTFKAISKKSLEELLIPQIDIKEQEKDVEILEKIYMIIQNKNKELKLLTDLISARFIEVFGNPESNSKGWKECSLSEKLNVLGGYAFKSDQFDENIGIPVLRIGNINAGYFKPVNMVYWKEDSKLAKYTLYPGDLVMSLTGTVGKDDYGNVCILGNDYEMYYLNQRNAKLEIKKDINKYYLSQLLRFKQIKKKLTGISRGVRQANISNKDILNLVIPIPPMELQEQFAAFVQQVNKSKFVIHKFLYCTTHNTKSIIKPRPNTKESGKIRGGKPHADEF